MGITIEPENIVGIRFNMHDSDSIFGAAEIEHWLMRKMKEYSDGI